MTPSGLYARLCHAFIVFFFLSVTNPDIFLNHRFFVEMLQEIASLCVCVCVGRPRGMYGMAPAKLI